MKHIYVMAIAIFTSLFGFAQIPTNGLVARYDFESNYADGSGNNLNLCDGTGGSQPIPPLQASNNTAHPAGDSAAYFNGLGFLDSYCSAVNGEFISSSVSISAWFKLDQLPSNYHTIACVRYDNNGSPNPYNTINLYTAGTNPVSGKLAVSFSTDGVIPNPTPHQIFDITVVGTTVLSSGIWYHATCTYDATTGTARLFLNGVEESNAVMNGNLLFNGSSALTIGHVEGGVGYNAFKGYIDEVLYYNRALTATEVENIYDMNASPCVVNIPDANFKNYLLGQTSINTNNNTEIECTEATAYTGSIIDQSGDVADLTGIEAFVNITYLDVSLNNISSVDLSQNISLTNIRLVGNPIATLDLSNNTALTSLDLANCTQLIALDLSNNSSLTAFSAGNNVQLASLNLANGNNTNMTYVYLANDNALTCIQVDNAAYCNANWTNPDNFVKPAGATYSENCAVTVTLPIAPTNLVLATPWSQYPNAIHLTWTDNANNEEGYTIERGTDGTNFVNVNGSGSQAVNTVMLDDYVPANGTYFYRVCAFNSAGQSCSSIEQITISGIAGIAENNINLTHLYPNPANSTLNIEVKENTNIKIADVLGKVVVTQKLNAGKNSIDVTGLISGAHFIHSDKWGAVKFIKE